MKRAIAGTLRIALVVLMAGCVTSPTAPDAAPKSFPLPLPGEFNALEPTDEFFAPRTAQGLRQQTPTPPPFGRFTWVYSSESSGNFPVRIRFADERPVVVNRGERHTERYPVDRYTVSIADPLKGPRRQPNWNTFELKFDLNPGAEVELVITTTSFSKVTPILVSLVENGEEIQRRLIQSE
ncbi:MAG: hypothetical protein IID08_03300 [Candidatus Hydrogenedentes bacterium]|nr:hypothetical protein [Candidatus Hydrogenedentota bacterium]